jgi:GT2 family glycosyltransferase
VLVDPSAVLVDVMLPALGDGSLVREAVTSVFAQSDPHWRLTVCDDGPAAGRDPGLGPWLGGFSDERVRYRVNPERLGINRNFQRCVDASTEALVVILGADDRLLPDFVGRVRALARRYPAAAFLHTGARVIDSAGRPSMPLADRVKALTAIRVPAGNDESVRTDDPAMEVGGERLAASLLRGNWMYFPSVVFRRDALLRHGFRPGHDIVLDLDLYLRILRDGGTAVLARRPGIEYRRHAGSLSSSGAADGSRFAEERDYFSETAAEMTAAGWPRAARAARWQLTSRLHRLARLAAAGVRAVRNGKESEDHPAGEGVRIP